MCGMGKCTGKRLAGQSASKPEAKTATLHPKGATDILQEEAIPDNFEEVGEDDALVDEIRYMDLALDGYQMGGAPQTLIDKMKADLETKREALRKLTAGKTQLEEAKSLSIVSTDLQALQKNM